VLTQLRTTTVRKRSSHVGPMRPVGRSADQQQGGDFGLDARVWPIEPSQPEHGKLVLSRSVVVGSETEAALAGEVGTDGSAFTRAKSLCQAPLDLSVYRLVIITRPLRDEVIRAI
jgi:hypothetical protein